jgi:hypothetical protein
MVSPLAIFSVSDHEAPPAEGTTRRTPERAAGSALSLTKPTWIATLPACRKASSATASLSGPLAI